MLGAKDYICDLVPYRPGKPLSAVAREYGVRPDKIIQLASNENPLGPSPKAVQALTNAGLHRYPDQHELTQALAAHHKINQDMLVLGNGSNDVLDLVARTFLGQGDEAVSPEHSFAVYRIATRSAGAQNIFVKRRNYQPDLSAMAKAVTPQTKVIWLDNPGNPTGAFVPYAQIRQFLQKIPKRVIVVVDEAYYEYLNPAEQANSVEWLAEHPNLILVRTFSKIYGLAGLRIGYGIAAGQVAELLNRARQPFNVNTPGLSAAVAALADQEFVRKSRRASKAGKAQLMQGFDELGLKYLPAHGNFVTVKVPSAEAVSKNLLPNGIIVRPLDSYAMPDFLRITVGTEAENAELLRVLDTA